MIYLSSGTASILGFNKIKIDATPTCVILRGDKREKHVGKPDIVSALKKLP